MMIYILIFLKLPDLYKYLVLNTPQQAGNNEIYHTNNLWGILSIRFLQP